MTPPNRPSRGKYIEDYSGCGCSFEAIYEELPGYCAKHGNIWQKRIGPRGGWYRYPEGMNSRERAHLEGLAMLRAREGGA